MAEGVPTKLIAGDTWKWCRSLREYSPNQGWDLTYSFRGASQLDVVGAPDGTGGWQMIAGAGDTAPLVAGSYAWSAAVSKGAERYTVEEGVVDVRGSLASVASPLDRRTSAEKQLAAVEAALESLLAKTHSTVTFGDQTYTLVDATKLMDIRNRLRAEVANAAGRGRRQILVTFQRP